MEAIAMHDFNATNEDELSFKNGSLLKILEIRDENWYKAEKDGRDGVVPRNYIKFNIPEWYHGQKSTKEVTEVLSNAGQPTGAFLIHDSESIAGDFELSVKNGDNVEHLKVLRDGAGKYFLWIQKFNSLNELIEYHRTSSVFRDSSLMLKDMLPANTAKALYDFEAEGSDELGFKKDAIIVVTEKVDTNWWRGELNGNTGLFPASYVKELY